MTSMISLSQNDEALASEYINQSIIRSHIGFLASDALRGRDTPSQEQEIAAEYIKSRFIEYGVSSIGSLSSYFQLVPFSKIVPPKEATVTLGEDQFSLNEDFFIMEGKEEEIQGEIVFVEYGGADDLRKEKIEGKIVIAICGDGVSQSPRAWLKMGKQKRNEVSKKGGIALIELFTSAQMPWNLLVRSRGGEKIVLNEDANPSLPHLWMNRSKEDLGNLRKKKLKAKISIKGMKRSDFMAKNVVGFVEGSDTKRKEEVIVYSAHYDHVGVGLADSEGDSIYNGARDNAVGSVTVLSVAQSIARYPTKRSALFVLFTGEEKGLLGSQYFVENSPIALEKIVFCFNSDNGGYNDTSVATIIGLDRTTAEKAIIKACEFAGLGAINDPAPEHNIFDRSDNVNFAIKGIPAPSFGLGFKTFDAELLKHYHKPSDEVESLDFDYLEKFFKAYVLSCRLIANGDETPFWTEGDKYYNQGVKLYQK